MNFFMTLKPITSSWATEARQERSQQQIEKICFYCLLVYVFAPKFKKKKKVKKKKTSNWSWRWIRNFIFLNTATYCLRSGCLDSSCTPATQEAFYIHRNILLKNWNHHATANKPCNWVQSFVKDHAHHKQAAAYYYITFPFVNVQPLNKYPFKHTTH